MAILHAESAIHSFKIFLHRAAADAEDRADFGVRLALDNPTEDFCLPGSESEMREVDRCPRP